MPDRMEETAARAKSGERRGRAPRKEPTPRGWLSRLAAAIVPQEALLADLRVYQADVLKDLRYGTE
jgi:hypothetical protein